MVKLLLLASALLCLKLADGFSSGFGHNQNVRDRVCADLMPGHGPDFQGGTGPYSLTVSGSGSQRTVEISGTEDFKGFILQASTGSFSTSGGDVTDVACSQGATISHTSSAGKREITATWSGTGPVSFKGAVVKNYATFYQISA